MSLLYAARSWLWMTSTAKAGVLGKKLQLIELDGKSDPVTVGNVAVQLVATRRESHYRPQRLRLWRARQP